jgi:hypothetical protein
MSPEDFLDYWRRNYGEVPLIGHVLRECFPRRWLRVHNLAESKRYADTEDERREILRRQNGLLNDLVGDGEPGEFIFGYYGEEERLPEAVVVALHGLQSAFLTTLTPRESGLDREYPLLKGSFAWKQSCLDTILLAVADDVLETPLIVSAERRCIVAPYDGGVDIIVENVGLRDQLRTRYGSWLSKHPSGC